MNKWQLLIKSLYDYIFKKELELEHYHNNKYPKSVKLYTGRTLPNLTDKLKIDVRNFYTPNDIVIPKINNTLLNYDDIAKAALYYVYKNITYISDKTQFNVPEFWMFPFETYHTKKGDCEDGAILLANILLKSGIPYWRIRIVAGDVKSGNDTSGHCYCCYLKEDTNEWYILDWCFFYNESKQWLKWKDAKKYLNIWFSFNTKYCFSNDKLDRDNIKDSEDV
jgi:hypothetical protein